MSKMVEIQKSDDPRDVIHQVIQFLAEGHLVGLPTETVYCVGAGALHAEAVEKLRQLHAGTPASACTLAVKGGLEALDFVPNMSRMGKKLSRRCWPGPVTLLFPIPEEEGLCTSLPPPTLDAVAPDGLLRLRAPAHTTIVDILRLMPSPLVLSSENVQPELLRTATDVASLYGKQVAMIIDDGPCRYGQSSSEVQVEGEEWKLVREAVVTARTVSRLASEVYLFVCTGNTCRSPMAEGLFRKMLAEKLTCQEDELANQGYIVASAGLAASMGGPPSPESVEIMRSKGVDLNGHASQPLTERLLETADHIYTMTRSHRENILHDHSSMEDRVGLLSRESTDICDPIGFGMRKYRECADEIEHSLRAILAEIPVG